MRKLITAAFLTLDGVMQAPGGPGEDDDGGFAHGGWIVPHVDEATGNFVDGWFQEPFDLLLGRRTYDIFAGYWPHQPADNPIAEKFNRVGKYVATSSRAPLAWANSVALNDVPAEVKRLKQSDGPTLVTQGSTVLVQTLMEHGLIDELRLITFPLVLGSGKRLFGSGTMSAGLKQVEASVSSTGAVMAIYRPDGPVKTGSF